MFLADKAVADFLCCSNKGEVLAQFKVNYGAVKQQSTIQQSNIYLCI